MKQNRMKLNGLKQNGTKQNEKKQNETKQNITRTEQKKIIKIGTCTSLRTGRLFCRE